jgi:hypothetical protein
VTTLRVGIASYEEMKARAMAPRVAHDRVEPELPLVEA